MVTEEKLYPRLLAPPRQSFFLFGPRGAGKSTWARQAFPDAVVFDLLDEALFQDLLADISLFGAHLETLEPGQWVWVDQVQRLAALLNEVHRFIEKKKLRFILTGSSSRKLRRGGVNLLAGRALQRTMFPLLPEELGGDFNLETVLQTGSLPIVWTSADPEETLTAYVRMYLKEEIQAEALTRNLPGFARFLPVAALSHGQVVNASTISREAGIARTTVTGYLEILEDTLLTFSLRAFEGKLRLRERRHPKLYWVDPGLVRAVKRSRGPVLAEERGHLLEGWIAVLLRAYAAHRDLYDDIYYWAPSDSRVEVDFLLERDGEFVALEVKSSLKVAPESLKGLRAINSLKGLRRRILIYGGRLPLQTEDGIEVWPLGKLLDGLAKGGIWPGT